MKLSDLSQETRDQIKVIEIGSSDDMEVGDQVVAIGNALGYGQSVTKGIISARIEMWRRKTEPQRDYYRRMRLSIPVIPAEPS